MTKWIGLFFIVALIINLATVSQTRADDGQLVELQIENYSEEPIRCVMILAHFVTRTLPPIPTGDTFRTTLERDPVQGTLSYGSFGDHPMMLENLLCGTLSDWTGTSRDLPIVTMRSEPSTRFNYRCTLVNNRIACVVH